jgi:hypothetical protein
MSLNSERGTEPQNADICPSEHYKEARGLTIANAENRPKIVAHHIETLSEVGVQKIEPKDVEGPNLNILYGRQENCRRSNGVLSVGKIPTVYDLLGSRKREFPKCESQYVRDDGYATMSEHAREANLQIRRHRQLLGKGMTDYIFSPPDSIMDNIDREYRNLTFISMFTV